MLAAVRGCWPLMVCTGDGSPVIFRSSGSPGDGETLILEYEIRSWPLPSL